MNRFHAFVLGFSVLLAGLAPPSYASDDCDYDLTWPLGKSEERDEPISDTYGPRLLSGDYDFHPGLDIPVDSGSNVYAVADGVVRLAGKSSGYTDPVVQIKHENCDGTYWYSNYHHMSKAKVSKGATVTKGQLIGLSGEPSSGFEHLHFEIRDGKYNQRNAIHPLRRLPYSDDGGPELEIENISVTSSRTNVEVRVAVPYEEIDLTLVEIEIEGVKSGSVVMSDSKTYDLDDWNYTYHDSGDVDDSDLDGVKVELDDFTTRSDYYELLITFKNLDGLSSGRVDVTVRAEDASGNVTTVTGSKTR